MVKKSTTTPLKEILLNTDVVDTPTATPDRLMAVNIAKYLGPKRAIEIITNNSFDDFLNGEVIYKELQLPSIKTTIDDPSLYISEVEDTVALTRGYKSFVSAAAGNSVSVGNSPKQLKSIFDAIDKTGVLTGKEDKKDFLKFNILNIAVDIMKNYGVKEETVFFDKNSKKVTNLFVNKNENSVVTGTVGEHTYSIKENPTEFFTTISNIVAKTKTNQSMKLYSGFKNWKVALKFGTLYHSNDEFAKFFIEQGLTDEMHVEKKLSEDGLHNLITVGGGDDRDEFREYLREDFYALEKLLPGFEKDPDGAYFNVMDQDYESHKMLMSIHNLPSSEAIKTVRELFSKQDVLATVSDARWISTLPQYKVDVIKDGKSSSADIAIDLVNEYDSVNDIFSADEGRNLTFKEFEFTNKAPFNVNFLVGAKPSQLGLVKVISEAMSIDAYVDIPIKPSETKPELVYDALAREYSIEELQTITGNVDDKKLKDYFAMPMVKKLPISELENFVSLGTKPESVAAYLIACSDEFGSTKLPYSLMATLEERDISPTSLGVFLESHPASDYRGDATKSSLGKFFRSLTNDVAGLLGTEVKFDTARFIADYNQYKNII